VIQSSDISIDDVTVAEFYAFLVMLCLTISRRFSGNCWFSFWCWIWHDGRHSIETTSTVWPGEKCD